mgnify:CR=1 FL=1
MMQRVLMSSGLKRMSGMTKVRAPMMVMRSFADAAELTIEEKPMNHPEDQGIVFQETSIVPHGDAGTFAAPINVSVLEYVILLFLFFYIKR